MITDPPNVIFPAEARWWRLADTVRGIGAPYGAVGVGHDGRASARHTTERGLRFGRLAGQAGEPCVYLRAGDDPALANPDRAQAPGPQLVIDHRLGQPERLGGLVDRVGQARAIARRLAVKLGQGVGEAGRVSGTDETTAAQECGPGVMSTRASVPSSRRMNSATGPPGPGGTADMAASARTRDPWSLGAVERGARAGGWSARRRTGIRPHPLPGGWASSCPGRSVSRSHIAVLPGALAMPQLLWRRDTHLPFDTCIK